MKKSYELGAVAKIELDSIQYSIKNMQLEIDVLKRNLLKLKEKFAYDFGIEIGDNSLQEIVPPSNLCRGVWKKGYRVIRVSKEKNRGKYKVFEL